MLTAATSRLASPAPALLKQPTPRVVDEFVEVRRTLAIELAVEAAVAEDAGASAEIVEALRAKARSILGQRPGSSLAPAPLVLRHSTDGLTLISAV